MAGEGGSGGGLVDRRSESWLTAAIPVDHPYCSCKLTRVRLAQEEMGGLMKKLLLRQV